MSVLSNSFSFRVIVAAFLAATCVGELSGASGPQITAVQFSGNSGAYTLTITGSGFGNPTVTLPYTGDVSNFRIGDDAQIGFGEWGYTGDANVLGYESWTDTSVTVSGFGGSPGDAIIIALWNASSGVAATWGGTVPTTASGPRITSVQLSGTGQNLQIVVKGSGFGSAPMAMPFTGDLNYFWFLDFQSQHRFEAGSQRWNVVGPDSVSLNYASWSDSQIVIAGFAGTYGQGSAIYQAGDAIAVAIWNTSDTSFTGPQTAWGGAVQAVTFAPGDQLIITFTATPNTADLLLLFNNDPLTITGSPVFTTSLYDGQTLLGTYTAKPFVYNGVSTFICDFASPGGGSGVSMYNPTTVPFTSINSGTIAGRLVTTISGGSVSGFNLADVILYDASSVPGGYKPLPDIATTSLTLQTNPAPSPTPSITSLSPDSAAAGGPAFTLTVNGAGFVSGATVQWSGIPLSTSFVSATQLTASVPASLIASSGSPGVTVLNPGGTGSNPATFNIPFAPGDQLIITFTAAVNTADLLLLFNNDPLTITGSPVFTTNLYDGNTLLGTYTAKPFAYNGVSTFICAFASPGGGAGASMYNPTTIPFTSINNGTIAGRLVTTISGGSVSGFNLADLILYDASSVSNGFEPLPDVATTSLTFQTAPASPSGPTINSGGVVNAASYGAPVAPGSIASVFGSFLLSSLSQAPGVPWPTSLSGLSMQFGGEVQAPLYFVSGGQAGIQIPWELAGQSQTSLTVTVNGQTSASQTVNLAPFAPGIFTTNAQGTGQGAIIDNSTYQLVDSSNPATPGSTYIQIYCTGLGAVTNQPATGAATPSSPLSWTTTTPAVTIGGVPASPVQFYGLAPGYVGLYQVNAQVPPGIPAGAAVPVAVSIGGVASNTVTIAVQGPTGTGTLDVQVTGLPGGTPANVSITSTNGYSKAITASASLQVPSGTYTITANSVAAGNASYYASAQQTVNVAPDATANAQVAYNTVIPNTTKVLDQTGTSTLTIAADGSTLTMSAQSAVAQSLAPGDVLAAAPTSAAPHGLLRKIVSVTQAAGQVTATTTQAALTDAIQQADIQFSANLLAQNIKSTTALRPGVEVHIGGRAASARISPGGPPSATSPMDTSDICANSQIVLTETGDVEITPGLDVSGDIKLCGNFTIQTSVNWLGLQLNSLTATATFGAHTDLTTTGSVAQWSGTQPIATIEFGDIIVPVGPIPVDVVPQVTIQIGANGAGVPFTAGVSQNASVTGGFSYANGQVSPILQSTPLTFQIEPLAVTADLTATASIEADISLLFYDIAGPYFDPQAYLQFDANVLQNPWWTLSGGLKGPVGLQLNPDLDPLGFVNLPQITFGDLFNISQTFLSAGVGFPVLVSLSPNAAPAGSQALTLTLTGSNFTSGVTANFNGVPLSTTFVNASQLIATLPASDLTTAGSFPVTVVNPGVGGATSAPLNFTVQATGNPLPAITNLSPPSAAVGSGPLTLTINGTGFMATSSVAFNGVAHTAAFVSSTQLTITLDSSDLANAGTFAVVVTNPPPGGGTSIPASFTVSGSSRTFILGAGSDGNLYEIVPTTGSTTLIGTMPSVMSDIAAFDGTLYGISFADIFGSSSLFSLNPNTGAGTAIGGTGVSLNALAFSRTGTLYAAGGDSLYTINTTSGSATLIGSGSGSGSYNSSGDLEFDSAGSLYLTSLNSGSSDQLFSVSPTTGQGSIIGSIGFDNVYGLAYFNGTLYGFTAGGQVITIDTTTGAGTFVANYAPGFDGATVCDASGGGPSPALTLPAITAVSSVLPQQNQTITISGSGFGTLNAYSGDSSYIEISDLDGQWNAGYGSNLVTLNVTSWTHSQIVIQGFQGSYGQFGWSLNSGDYVSIQVWNPQTGAGPTTFVTQVLSP
jgi:uncharacterized protein (TIGR03437 family)